LGNGGSFHPSRLLARASAGGGLTLVTIDAPAVAKETYVSPGQYVEVRAGDGGATGYFVLSGEPGARPWELIMRSGGGASDVLLVAPVGTPIEVTDAIGDGFPLERVRGRSLVVVLGGTGIAAGRPILNRRIREGDAARTRVLVGVRSRAELALQGDLDRWATSGVDLLVCRSQDGAYVQDALRVLGPELGVGTLVFAVGPAPMVDALRSSAPKAGLAPADVLTNH
jgi:NAD(P)H-flavin reductase